MIENSERKSHRRQYRLKVDFICSIISFFYKDMTKLNAFRFLNPIVYGDYPQSMRDLVGRRLPTFTKDETTFIMNSFDFLGINYYTANYAKDNPSDVHPAQSYLNDIHATLSSMHSFKYTF